MTWFALQSLFLIVAAFLLGLFAGRLAWGPRTQPQATASIEGEERQPAAQRDAGTPVAASGRGRVGGPAAEAAEALLRSVSDTAHSSTTTARSGAEAPDGNRSAAPAAARVAGASGPEGDGGDAGSAALPPTPPHGVPAASGDDDVESTHGQDAAAADDLTRVEGLGPKAARALRAAGVRRFGDLASMDDGELRSILRGAGLRFPAGLPTWSSQAARLAADGSGRPGPDIPGATDAGRAGAAARSGGGSERR